METALLARRRRAGQMWVADPDDAFWLLLLHRLLDKRSVTPQAAAELIRLAPHATADAPLAQVVDAARGDPRRASFCGWRGPAPGMRWSRRLLT